MAVEAATRVAAQRGRTYKKHSTETQEVVEIKDDIDMEFSSDEIKTIKRFIAGEQGTGENIIHVACRHLDILNEIVQRCDVSSRINEGDNNGRTPLMKAAHYAHKKDGIVIIDVLLKNGATLLFNDGFQTVDFRKDKMTHRRYILAQKIIFDAQTIRHRQLLK